MQKFVRSEVGVAVTITHLGIYDPSLYPTSGHGKNALPAQEAFHAQAKMIGILYL